jgi:ferredoxin
MSFHVRIEKKSCQSSGSCVNAAPEAFGWDDDDLGDVRPGAESLTRDRLISIAQGCPALCISIFDENGREIDVD